MTYSQTQQRGFTIIETLVAIGILATVIVAATGAVQRASLSYIFSKDQITAFYLAQEGFEQIRNIRDENVINGRNWLAGIAQGSADPCYFGQACTVSPIDTTAAIRCAAPGDCPVLRRSPLYGLYSSYPSGWTATTFKREIMLTALSPEEFTITVTVTWTQGASTKQFRAKENILNWR